tara:strand:- start:185 stop:607 length:423 start_codon:yes stop_codon:yes gene_type:complete
VNNLPQWTENEQLRLLAYLILHPKRAARPVPAFCLLMKRWFFTNPKAQWLALELVLCEGRIEAISKDAQNEGKKWFAGFEKNLKEEGFAELPKNIKEVSALVKEAFITSENSKKGKIPSTPPTPLRIAAKVGGVGPERSF